MNAIATAEAPATPTLDDQIRAFIPQILPTALQKAFAVRNRSTHAEFYFPAAGSWADQTLHLRHQPAVQELLKHLETVFHANTYWNEETADIIRKGVTQAYVRVIFKGFMQLSGPQKQFDFHFYQRLDS